ncbi:hypothetical protein NDA13_005872 [Ustilago tritici]|nr:hypothetical protein NDA13_005872 [Ustilago tritici]
MGGGDLNMKKSWHPLLQVNQERVWKREKEALEERKKLEELRREREQEREMQELQRLQEEAGGKKRIDRVDWMYATPATTGSNSAAEMEEYLLGKKRVDKLLRGDEAEKVSKNSQQNLISLQNANSARDLAAKVREDPMLAIKQQEQAAYEALLRDPARLRQLKLQACIDVNKESKEERRRRKEEKRRRHDDDDGHKRRRYGDDDRDSDRRHRSRHSDSRGDSHSHRHGEDRDGKSRDRDRSPRRDGESSSHRRHHDEHRSSRRHHDSERCRRERARPPSSHKYNEKHRSSRHSNGEYSDRRSRSHSRSVSPVTDRRRQDDLPPRFGDSYRPQPCSRDPRFRNGSSSASTRSREEEGKRKEEIRQQKLREMEQNAKSMEEQRTSFVSKINAEEAEQDRKEAELRQKLIDAKAKGHSDGKGGFLLDQQRKTFGDSVDLAERMRRDRGRLQRMD